MFIGTAGWTIPAPYKAQFPAAGTHLQRYAAKMNAVEINSSFYRPHQAKTYARWADSVPDDFRFAVKLPRAITHEKRLQDCDDLSARFLAESDGLGKKRGALLVQLPPSLVFEEKRAAGFFKTLRRAEDSWTACEPRHPSWFTAQADATLIGWGIARVAADPPRGDSGGTPGGARPPAYYRWYGSPRTYYSSYDEPILSDLAASLQPNDWCIFDNTAAFAALGNALALDRLARAA